MEMWHKLLDWLKQPPRIIAAITIASGFILFSPLVWQKALRLDTAVYVTGPFPGIVFILGCSLLLTSVVASLYSAARKRYLRARSDRIRPMYLHGLTADEKTILRYYTVRRTRTQTLSVQCGKVAGLVAHQIIQRAANIAHADFDFDFNIEPWAWDYLQKHPNLLED
jgi:hypothetical protein